jgi:hypothetical protein
MLGYGEFIDRLDKNEVFVFGANKQGFHGAGSAGFASFGVSGNRWREFDYGSKPNGWKGKWNVKGVGEGLQEGSEGKSYALPTVSAPGKKCSLSLDDIANNIAKFYAVAMANPDLRFLVAYSAIENKPNLCGYSNEKLAALFAEAGEIPSNVVFSNSYVKLIEAHLMPFHAQANNQDDIFLPEE